MKRSKKIIFGLLLLLLLFMVIQRIKVANSLSNKKVVISKTISEVVIEENVDVDDYIDNENIDNTEIVEEVEVIDDKDNTIVVKKLSDDVSLKGIIPSSGELQFDDSFNYYEIEVYEDNISFEVLVNATTSIVKGNESRELIVGENSVVITIQAEDGTERDIFINVIRKEIVRDIIVPDIIVIGLNESIKLEYEIISDMENVLVEFSSDNIDVVTLDDGIVYGNDYGISLISVCSGEKCASTLVKVVHKELISSIYNIDRNNGLVISNMPDIDVNGFVDNFDNDNEFLVLDNVDFVGTGMSIKLIINDIEYDSLKICVLGDLNGDGKVTSIDREIMKNILLESEIYEEIIYVAADLDGDGIIGMADDVLMKKYIKGEINNF